MTHWQYFKVFIQSISSCCMFQARIRILALVAKLFALSSSLATAVYSSNLLNLFEVEINNGHDMLTTLSALELLYEVGTIQFAVFFFNYRKLLTC